jgi:hypothetical protein
MSFDITISCRDALRSPGNRGRFALRLDRRRHGVKFSTVTIFLLELSPNRTRLWSRHKGSRPIVRGFPRRIATFSLRDLFPFGALRRAGANRRRWVGSRAGRPGDASSNADRLVPDHHVLDYRTLDSVRLVFGEIYADH